MHAKEISNCIKSGGKIYVCGDAKHMVHDVQQAFIEAVKVGFGNFISCFFILFHF